MDSKISDILDDIYRIDPTLKAKEAEIVIVVGELLKIKPNLEPDSDFIVALRNELENRIQEIYPRRKRRISFFGLRPGQFSFSFGVVALLFVLVIFKGGLLNNRDAVKPDSPEDDMTRKFVATGVVTSRVSDGAFGLMEGDIFSQPIEMGAGPSEIEVNYVPHYIYAGGDFSGLIGKKMDVLKRGESVVSNKGGSESDVMLNFGLFDVNNLDDAFVRGVSFCESSPSGYCFDTYFEHSRVRASIFNYSPSTKYDNSAYASDEERAIAIADDFIRKYKFNMDSYGQPVRNASYLDSMTIVYPLLIDGREVYSEFSDELVGVTVEVSLAYNLAESANIEAYSYQSAIYDTQSDPARISEAIGQYINWKNIDVPNPQVVDLEVGDPKLCYRLRTYLKEDNVNYEEYLVPALAFSVKDKARANEIGAEETVIVPIVQSFYK